MARDAAQRICHGTRLAMPVAYYSQLLAVAYGATPKQAGLDGHVIQPKKL
jgi:heterodisulfide reductase subunit B